MSDEATIDKLFQPGGPLDPKRPSAVPQPAPNPILGAIGESLGRNLSGAGTLADIVFNKPGQAVRAPLGGALQWAGLANQGGDEGVGQGFNALLTGNAPNANPGVQAIARAMSVTPAGFGYRLAPVPTELKQSVLQQAIDPWNLVGWGIFGKAAQGVAQGSRLQQALLAAHALDTAYTGGVNQLLKGAGNILKLPGKIPLPEGIAPTIIAKQDWTQNPTIVPGAEDFVRRKAKNVGELLGSLSNRSVLKEYEYTLRQMAAWLQASEHDIIHDTARWRTGVEIPEMDRIRNSFGALHSTQLAFWKELRDEKNPVMKMLGLQIYEKVLNEWAQSMSAITGAWKQAVATGNQGTIASTIKQAYLDELPKMYLALEAGRDYFMASVKTRQDIPNLTWQQAGTAGSMIRSAHRQVGGALDDFLRETLQAPNQNAREAAMQVFQAKAGSLINPNVQNAITHLGQPVADFMAQAGPEVALGYESRREAFNMLPHAQKLPAFLADLPSELRPQAVQWYTQLEVPVKQLRDAREKITGALKLAWQNNPLTSGQPFPALDIHHNAPGSARIGWVNDVLQKMQLSPIQSVTELSDRLFGLVPDTTLTGLHTAINRFPGGDMLVDNLYPAAIDRAVRNRADALQIRPGKAGEAWDKINSLIRSDALMSISYNVTNLLGGLINAGLTKQNPVAILREFRGNMGNMLRGQPVQVRLADNVSNVLGVDAPAILGRESTGQLPATTLINLAAGKAVDVHQQLGPLKTGLIYGVPSAMAGYFTGRREGSDTGETTKKAALAGAAGAAYGMSMPALSKVLLKGIAAGVEDVLRKGGWAVQMAQRVESRQGDLARIIHSAGAPNVYNHIASGGAPGGIAGWISPEALGVELVKAGVDVKAARAAGNAWREILHKESTEAKNLVLKAQFDYSKLNRLEDVTRQFSMFSVWAMKAMPFYAEMLATHPGIALGLMAYKNISDQNREKKNLTERFWGSGETPVESRFFSQLLGRPVEVYTNPLRTVLPFADLDRAVGTRQNEDQGMASRLMQVMKSLGLGFLPQIEEAAKFTGALGSETPSGTILPMRLAPLIELATGVDIREGQRGVLDAARRGLGQRPTDLKQAAIDKRIDELALSETGLPITARDARVAQYQLAKTNKSGPIYEKALDQTKREEVARGVTGVVSSQLSPQAILPKEEGQIREARKEANLVPDDIDAYLRDQLAKNPEGMADPQVVARLREVADVMIQQYLNGKPPPGHLEAFSRPTLKNMSWVAGELRKAEMEVNPASKGYSGFGSPEERQLSQLLTQYNNPAALLADDPAFAKMPPEVLQQMADYISNPELIKANTMRGAPPPSVLTLLQRKRDILLKENPILAEYLAYLQGNRGQGNVEEFLNQRARKVR